MKSKKQWLEYVGFLMPLVLALVCLLSVTVNHHQATLPIPMPQEFIGEYSFDGEHWETLTPESELSARNKDLSYEKVVASGSANGYTQYTVPEM